jgi:hypothetical protein
MSAWNDFVKKIYHEGHNKNKSYSFKQALKDASRRKGEMSNMPSSKSKTQKKVSKRKQKKTRRH